MKGDIAVSTPGAGTLPALPIPALPLPSHSPPVAGAAPATGSAPGLGSLPSLTSLPGLDAVLRLLQSYKLIAALAEAWGVEELGEAGKCVWFEVRA